MAGLLTLNPKLPECECRNSLVLGHVPWALSVSHACLRTGPSANRTRTPEPLKPQAYRPFGSESPAKSGRRRHRRKFHT